MANVHPKLQLTTISHNQIFFSHVGITYFWKRISEKQQYKCLFGSIVGGIITTYERGFCLGCDKIRRVVEVQIARSSYVGNL
jgi:hypothetical protein